MRTYNPSVKQVGNCKCSIRNQMGMAAKGAHVMSCTWESKSTWNPYNDSVSIQGLLFIALQLLISNICSWLFNIRCVSISNVKCSHPAIKCSPTIHLPSTWRCCSTQARGMWHHITISDVQRFKCSMFAVQHYWRKDDVQRSHSTNVYWPSI